jgi:hypothetical protein
MAKPGGVFRHLLIWTYERGTIQYDIICGLILAFIFFMPRSCFISKRQEPRAATRIETSQPTPPPQIKHP